MPVPDKILQLVDRFDRNIADYKRGAYNEAQTRREFIDPFFQALGWDIDNSQGKPESQKEVIHEAKVNVEDAVKAPDYCFRIGKDPKFFVEAKKPSVSLKDNIHPAYQLRRYGWSAKLPLSILTDFEEFAVYDCRVMPEKQDKATNARLWYLTYSEYAEKWEEIFKVFSREAIVNGSCEHYVEARKDKRGILPVDVAFLQEIEHWRETLAQRLALRNSGVTRRELNFAVQRIIDRIIFLRICEDRGIEPYEKLKTLLDSTNVYAHLVKRFYKADARYNSGIFHFKAERDHPEPPDTLTPTLTIDDDALKGILKKLYYPDSPYAFKVIPLEILGQVYEQFLGKVICLDAQHRATVEEKPEVKKAGGVYYTPTYIVDYIVKQTVGELLQQQDRTGFKNLSGLRLTILDPACGSGSFLIGAYQYLLDWHRDQYVADDPQKWSKGKRPRLCQTDEHDWTLTIDERKRILLTHIYGVDIDSQAVEVTKLSLLLKVLEGEDEQTISRQMALFHERVLPDLAGNIKCGNSLIGSDFYVGKQESLLDEEEMYRVNAFDWDREFAEIIQAGGFDAVIGNPPYVRSQLLDSETKAYLTQKYTAPAYQPDTFAFFLQKGIDLLKNKGRLGYIIPNGILTNTYYGKLRRYILDNTAIEVIVDLKDGVFAGVSVDTSIFILRRENIIDYTHAVKIGEHHAKIHKSVVTPSNIIEQNTFLETTDYAFNTKINTGSVGITKKLCDISNLLGESFEVKAGMKVRKDFVTESKLDERYKCFLLGGDIKPYQIGWSGKWVCYDRELESAFTNQAFRDENIFLTSPKILIRQVMGKDRIYATIDSAQFYVDQTIYVLIPQKPEIKLSCVLGLLCSRLMTFYFSRTLADGKQTFPKIKAVQIKQLPFPIINFSNPTDKARHDQMVELVERMLNLYKQLADANIPQAQTLVQRQIDATDRQIDRLVYELYGLTEEEIQIVESGTN